VSFVKLLRALKLVTDGQNGTTFDRIVYTYYYKFTSESDVKEL